MSWTAPSLLLRFLSTLSLRRATLDRAPPLTSRTISIHALLAESDSLGLLGWLRVLISIHALLAESDHPKTSDHPHKTNFYPRSPCGERLSTTITITCIVSFLSTLSLRRATRSSKTHDRHKTNFYPRSPCGERRLSYAL